MKVFWSWQGDTAVKTGRNLIREALAEAITGTAGGGRLCEAAREGGRTAAGGSFRPGPPEIGRRIFRQIRECDIFVADLTAREEICNPNVAIELGYFQAVKAGASLIIVRNAAFARRDLSFPGLAVSLQLVTYDLPERSAPAEIARVRIALVDEIGGALRECGGLTTMPARVWSGADGAGARTH